MTICMASHLPFLYPQAKMCATENGKSTAAPVMTCPAEESNNVNTWVPVYGLWVSHNAGFGVPAK